jgi:hypothetical protein
VIATRPAFSLALPPSTRSSGRSSDLVRSIESRLRRSGYLALGDVACELNDGVAILHGRVPSYYLKQVAQEIAGDAAGIRGVINQIEVAPSRHREGNRAGGAPNGIPAFPDLRMESQREFGPIHSSPTE